MKRIQFYLEPELDQTLKELAGKFHVSKAQLIREGIRNIIRERAPAEKDPLMGIIGLGRGGAGAVSVEHDLYLAERKLQKQ